MDLDKKVIKEMFLWSPKERKLLPKYRKRFRDYNLKLCSKCGGKCCEICGCHFSPTDFKEISFEYLKNEIKKGYITIDRIPEEETYDKRPFGTMFLRIRNLGEPIVENGRRSKHYGCILLSEKGCKLSKKERPRGGKALIPVCDKKTGKVDCRQIYNSYSCSYEWQLYQKVLYELTLEFKDKDYKSIL